MRACKAQEEGEEEEEEEELPVFGYVVFMGGQLLNATALALSLPRQMMSVATCFTRASL